MDTDQLRTALALIDHHTINRAAAALGLAPSSVSDRIRRLEKELGRELFVRHAGGMRLTATGRTYLEAAADALTLLDDAGAALLRPRPLTVGAQASIADHILPEVLADLQRRSPDLEVRLCSEPDRNKLLTALVDGEVDALVVLDEGEDIGGLGFAIPDPTLEFLDLRDIPMACVVAPNHPLLGRPVTRPMIAATGQLVGREPRCSFWMATQRWLGPDTDLTAVGGLAQVRQWAADGRGIALLPEFAVFEDLATGRLVPLQTPVPPLRLRLIWQPRSGEHPAQALLYALTQA